MRLLIGTTLVGFLVGCGGEAPMVVEEAAGAVSAPLATSTLCDTLNKVTSMTLDGTPLTVTAACDSEGAGAISYLGSAPTGQLYASRARNAARAIYCAVKGADAHNAIAQFDTPLGKMGIQSRINITNADPSVLHVAGQRVGSLVVFGQLLDLESQTFDFSSPTEYQPAQAVLATKPGHVVSPNMVSPPIDYVQNIPSAQGQYSVLKEGGNHWNIEASGVFPFDKIVLSGTLKFRSESPYDSGNTSAYAMHVQQVGGEYHPENFPGMFQVENDSEKARRSSWDTAMAQCNACVAAGHARSTCPCPNDQAELDHERHCGASGCTDAYYSNLNDGRLPYEGTKGASGPYLDQGPFNWWHFGTPKDGQVVPVVSGEPVYSLLGNDDPAKRTTSFLLDLGVSYSWSVVTLSFTIHNQLDFRSGLAVRENQLTEADSKPAIQNNVSTWLDAEARAQIGAHATIVADLPFVGEETLLDLGFTIMDQSARSNSAAARYASKMEWTDEEPSIISSYSVGGVDTSSASCLDVPAASNPAVVPNDPRVVAQNIAQADHDNLFPCNIAICDPKTAKLNQCSWHTDKDSKLDSMTCQATAKSCTCAEDHVDMCSASGKVYPGTKTSHTYCDQQQCGSAQACVTDSNCGAGGVCSAGCCQSVK